MDSILFYLHSAGNWCYTAIVFSFSMNNADKEGELTIIPSAAAKVPAYSIYSAGNTIDTAVLLFVLQTAANYVSSTAKVFLFYLYSAGNRLYTAVVFPSSMNNAGKGGGLTIIPS